MSFICFFCRIKQKIFACLQNNIWLVIKSKIFLFYIRIDPMINEDNESISEDISSLTSLCLNGNCTDDYTRTLTDDGFPNAFLIILILSVLCFFGVCFMIFGPLQRSEAYKRVENFTFGRHPIFNIDHRVQSTASLYAESMEFSNI